MLKEKRILMATLFLCLFLNSCDAASGTEGTIVSINANAPLSDSGIATSQLTLEEELNVMLEDGTIVTATCSRDLLSSVKLPASEFTYTIRSMPFDMASGKFMANISITLTYEQKVTLEGNDSDGWIVVEVKPVQ